VVEIGRGGRQTNYRPGAVVRRQVKVYRVYFVAALKSLGPFAILILRIEDCRQNCLGEKCQV
jgi:hypothetical protein